MTLKDTALKQPAFQEQPGSQNPTVNSLEDHAKETAETVVRDQPLHPDISLLIRDEVLRHKIRTLIEEKPTPSQLNRLLNSSLVTGLIITVVGFLLTGALGAYLANYYSVKQQELASQRSFLDELNKTRVQKIGEVWEQVDKNEILLDDLLEKANKASNAGNQKTQTVDAINNLIQEDRVVINQNRFWLGEENYNKLQGYLDKNSRLALNMLLASEGADFSGIIEERKHAKQDVLQVRESMRSENQPGK